MNRPPVARLPKKKASISRTRQGPKFVTGGTTLYAQLASVLRSRVVSGEWTPDTDMPSIDELCAQYGVARITVRQALQILTGEGLISSQRGRRTFVTGNATPLEASPLVKSLTNVGEQAPDYTIRMISRARATELPAVRWAIGHSAGPYVFVRKVDCTGDSPYAYSGLYVAEDIWKRFPRGAENRFKLVRLVVKYATNGVTQAHERVRVAAADYEEAAALGCDMAAPVARVERVFCDANGRVVYLGNSTYIGVRYTIERRLDEYLDGM